MHETSDDVRLEVGSDGVATVLHHLRYRIVAGRFKTFDLVGVDPRAEVSPEAVLTAEKSGAEVVARVEPVPKTPGTLRIMIDEGKGLGRGTYVVDVKYRLDLVATDDHGQQSAQAPLAGDLGPRGTFDADLAELSAGAKRGRSDPRQRAMFLFRGFALGDLALATEIYRLAQSAGCGLPLPR